MNEKNERIKRMGGMLIFTAFISAVVCSSTEGFLSVWLGGASVILGLAGFVMICAALTD